MAFRVVAEFCCGVNRTACSPGPFDQSSARAGLFNAWQVRTCLHLAVAPSALHRASNANILPGGWKISRNCGIECTCAGSEFSASI